MQFLSNLFMPSLDWIQIEVTSHCNAECVYCPRTVYGNSWRSGHMPVGMFRKLSRAFHRTDLAYLQGWGEPLLHPEFFEMVRIAKECGCRVGTTTNGMLCDDKTAERIVREGLNIIGFSLAGTTDHQDEIRRGTRLRRVLEAIRLIDHHKKMSGSHLPEIHVAYMWLRSGINEIKELPTLLEGMGVNQVVVTTLDFLSHQNLSNEIVHARNANEETLLRRIASEVTEDGARRRLDIVFRLVATQRPPGMCTENVTGACFVSSRGLVSPCVFMNMPLPANDCTGEAGLCTPESLTFGDINDKSLSSIWTRKAYRTFRSDHAGNRSIPSCCGCPKLFVSS